jgi:nitrogenase molybdenum-iron protein alpha/beta subunit
VSPKALRLEGQLSLLQKQAEGHAENGSLILAALGKAIERIGRAETVAALAKVDPSSLTKMLKGQLNVHPALIAAVIALDHERVFATEIADMAGADILPRRQTTVEQENAALRSELKALREHFDTVAARFA